MHKNSLHPNTAVMLEAWQRISHAHTVTDEGPSAYDHPGLLGRLFVIEVTRSNYAPFRVTGDDLSQILGRNLIGTNFLDLWTGPDREFVEALMKCVMHEERPGLLRGFGQTSGARRVDIELALAPLGQHLPLRNRLLGLYQTLGGEAMLQNRSIWSHRVQAIFPPEAPQKRANLRLVTNNFGLKKPEMDGL